MKLLLDANLSYRLVKSWLLFTWFVSTLREQVCWFRPMT